MKVTASVKPKCLVLPNLIHRNPVWLWCGYLQMWSRMKNL